MWLWHWPSHFERSASKPARNGSEIADLGGIEPPEKGVEANLAPLRLWAVSPDLLQVPEAKVSVVSGYSQMVTVRRDGQCVDPCRNGVQPVPRLTARDLPDLNTSFMVRRGQKLAIRRERDMGCRAVFGELALPVSRGRIPELNSRNSAAS